MNFMRMYWLVALLPFGCADPFTEAFSEPLPPALPCDPNASVGADPVTGVSFDRADMLCVSIDMDPDEFVTLAGESRMGGSTNSEMVEQVLGLLISDTCTDPLPNLYQWYEADARVGGIARDRVGVRKKGFLGSVIFNGLIKPSIKIKTDKYVDDQTLGATERITLNNNNQDASRMRTCLAYDVFHAAGYPAPLCNLAAVMVNGNPLGAYSHVESMKKRMLRRAFGDDSGSLYEGTAADFSMTYLSEASAGSLGHWEAKTGDSDPRGGPLLAVTEALEAPDDQLLAALEPVLNLERFITFWALETLIAHTDSYSGGTNNFYVYFDPGDNGRATFMPWGTDSVFTSLVIGAGAQGAGGLATFQNSELSRRLARIPESAAMYQAELERLLDEVWDEAEILSSIDAYAAQVRTAQDDANYDETLDELRTWVRERRGELEGLLAQGLPDGDTVALACGDVRFLADILELVTKFTLAW